MSHRLANGQRVNQWGMKIAKDGKLSSSFRGEYANRHRDVRDKSVRPNVKPSHRVAVNSRTKTMADGSKVNQTYVPPVLSNPGNYFRVNVGYGQMGSNMAHENEAPFPVEVPKWFIATYAPPGGIILDPFSGSGTTCHASLELGRSGVGCDIRMSQCRIGRRRLRGVTPGFAFEFYDED